MIEDWNEALRFDREHLWHPYTSMTAPTPVWPVVSAQGVQLQLADGRQLIDGMASWWSAIHGYGHPAIKQALHEQIDCMSHVMFGGLTHQPAIELGQRLVALAPEPLEKVFLADSGSVAVEVALKMAMQYQQARQQPAKHRFLALRGGYHGDTFGAMSVCDPVTGMHQLFSGSLPQQIFAPRPACGFHDAWQPDDITAIEDLLAQHHAELAAVILEPIVQGAGGMHFYHPNYLRRLRALCDHYQVLLIADEIATGFGRTGRLFACDWAEITPDILCLGKALTGGTMTLAATLTTTDVAETISAGGAGCFMHGPTFMGNPLACRAAVASLDLLADDDWQARVQQLEKGLQQGLASAANLPGVQEVRVLGAIGVVELTTPVDMQRIMPAFVDAGVWVRPFGELVYIMPPYVTSNAELDQLTAAIVRVLHDYLHS